MKLAKTLRKIYYVAKLKHFDNADLYAHIGYEAQNQEQAKTIKEQLDRRRNYLVKKIKENK